MLTQRNVPAQRHIASEFRARHSRDAAQICAQNNAQSRRYGIAEMTLAYSNTWSGVRRPEACRIGVVNVLDNDRRFGVTTGVWLRHEPVAGPEQRLRDRLVAAHDRDVGIMRRDRIEVGVPGPVTARGGWPAVRRSDR